jgi:hypothetical protein
MSLLSTPPLPLTTTHVTAAVMVPDDPEDDWVDTDDLDKASKTVENISCPNWTFSRLKDVPKGLSLVNFVHDEKGHTLYRDEPVSKCYPGLRLSDKLASYSSLFVSVLLYFENSHRVLVRVPDIKSRTPHRLHLRRATGVFLSPQELDHTTISFKKKCVDNNSGLDTAFELGVNYSSHTRGIPSQFVFVVVPFHNGQLLLHEAERSHKFYVKSKRQQRFLTSSSNNKRYKKNTETLRLETDIQAARDIVTALRQELVLSRHICNEYAQLMLAVKNALPSLPEGAVKIGLLHGTRTKSLQQVASL